MAVTETIEGAVGALWYHYDLRNDVLYLQMLSTRGQETFSEETPDGFFLDRADDGQAVGLTILDWWRRFGGGDPREVTLHQIEARVETFSHKLAA